MNADSLSKKLSQYYSTQSANGKIVLIGHSSDKGGAEILLKNIAEELRRQDVEIVILLKRDGPLVEEYERIAPTFLIDDGEKIEFFATELAKHGYESAILNTVLTGDLTPLLDMHGYYTINLIHELPGVIDILNAGEFAYMIGEVSHLVVFPSSYVAEKFEELFEIKRDKLIQPQGFYNRYDNFNRQKSRQTLEDKYNIPKDNDIILNVGFAEKRKGFDLFYETSQKLKDDKFTFFWAGAIDDDMKEKYLDRVNDADNIIFTGFISDKDELMAYYDACDIFLLTSREDPFPSVVLEAFNAKKPVVAFENAGGFQDIVINNETGYLVDFESTDGLVEKIRLLSADESLRQRMGENAKRICEQHSFPKYVRTLTSYCLGDSDENVENDLTYLIDNEIINLENNIRHKNEKILNLKRRNNQLIGERRDIGTLKKDVSNLKKKNSKLTKQNKKLKKENKELFSSTSWKITSPIRKFKHVLKRLLKGGSKPAKDDKKSSKKSKASSAKKKTAKAFEKVYPAIYDYPYSYNTHISNENIKRVNLFFDRIDGSIHELRHLFSYLIAYCSKYEYQLRIVYSSADFEALNHFLKKHKITLPEDVSFLYLKEDNYLEIGLGEKYVCTSLKNARRLMNTHNLNSIIYYYLEDLEECTRAEHLQISRICYSDNVVILNDDFDKLKNLERLEYTCESNVKKITGNKKVMCCDFGEMFAEGIEVLYYLFLNSQIDEDWEIYVLTNKIKSRFSLNPELTIIPTGKMLKEFDLLIKIDYDKAKTDFKNENYIILHIDEKYDRSYDVLNIADKSEIDEFDMFAASRNRIFTSPWPIDEIFKKINGAE